jgi:DNA polymerase V
VLLAAALAGLQGIYQPGYAYAKAGVMLLELSSDQQQQGELAFQPADAPPQERSRLMATLDGLNQRYGRGTVLLASAGLGGEQRSWSMKQERRTPGYTTCWDDLAVARA